MQIMEEQANEEWFRNITQSIRSENMKRAQQVGAIEAQNHINVKAAQKKQVKQRREMAASKNGVYLTVGNMKQALKEDEQGGKK